MNEKNQNLVNSSISLDKKTFNILNDYAIRKSLSRSAVMRLLILEILDKKLKIIE